MSGRLTVVVVVVVAGLLCNGAEDNNGDTRTSAAGTADGGKLQPHTTL